MGLQLNWSQIKGCTEALGSYGIISNLLHRAHIANAPGAIRSFKVVRLFSATLPPRSNAAVLPRGDVSGR